MRRWFILLMPFLTNCAGQDTSSGGGPSVVRDSAGIRIVENTRPSFGRSVWRLSADPAVTIGTAEGDENAQLYQVRDALRLDDGTIVIANAGSFQLKYFDATGRFITNFGREGGGPGEFSGFQALAKVWRTSGGGVAAWGGPPPQMSTLDANGQFVASHSFSQEPGPFPQPIDALAGGRVVSYHTRDPYQDSSSEAPVGTIRRDSLRFVWYSADDAEWGEIAWLPGREEQTYESRGRRYWGTNPFGSLPAFAVGDSSFYYGSAHRYEIRRYAPDGTLQSLIRRTESDRTLSSSSIDAYIENRMTNAPDDPSQRREWRAALEAARFPDRIPAYRRIQVDRVQDLWVQAYSLPGDPAAAWSVFGPDGAWLTDVTTPIDFTIYEIGDDYVLGLWQDADDVEYVLMYELIKP